MATLIALPTIIYFFNFKLISPSPLPVVLPNITHTALQDLITFIYCGEVNVKNEALSTFISTAESLQIKGLTDNDTPKADTADIITPQMITINSPPPQQQSIPTPAPVAAPQPRVTNVARSAPKRASRPVPVVTQKVDSDDSGDEDHQPLIVRPPVTAPVVAAAPPAVKRQISSSSSSTAAPQKTYVNVAKRMKTVASTSTPNPTPNQTKKQKLQQQPQHSEPTMIIMKHEEEPEVMIEMPMAEEEQEVEEEEEVAQESLIEDDQTYGDMKYDETYFTETEDNKTVATSYGGGASRSVVDQSTMDTSNADHQG